MLKHYSIDQVFEGKKKILVVISHPDDFEDYFSGTMMYAFEKKIIEPSMVHLLVCTDGACGGRDKYTNPEELKKIRQLEQRKALAFLHIPPEQCTFLDFKDGALTNENNALTERISYHIRRLEPDMLLTHNGFEAFIDKPEGMYYIHRDHRVVGQAAMDAVYPFSRDLLFFPQHHHEGLDGHFVLHVLVAETQDPNVKVDVTSFIEKKIELIKQFGSQVDSDDWLRRYLKDTMAEGDQYFERFKYVKLVI